MGISEKRLLGWEPVEVQEHEYDDAGRLVRTVVTREAEWDDFERAKMQALADYNAGICECGLHRSVADEDPDLEVTIRRCPVCAGMDKNIRILHARDDAALKGLGENPAASADRPSDGRRLGLKFKPPEDPPPGNP